MIIDDSYLLILHAGDDPVTFTLPDAPWADAYEVVHRHDRSPPANPTRRARRSRPARALPIGARTLHAAAGRAPRLTGADLARNCAGDSRHPRTRMPQMRANGDRVDLWRGD